MPSSLPLSILLLFLYIVLPANLNKYSFNKTLPLVTRDLHLSEELMYFYLPTAISLLLLGAFCFSFFHSHLDADFVLAALGSSSALSAGFFEEMEKVKWEYFGFLLTQSMLLPLLIGHWHAKWRVKSIIQSKGILGRSFDPWFCLSVRREGENVVVDVLLRSGLLYTGELHHYTKSKEGEITSFVLEGVRRYSKESKGFKGIFGNYMHFFASDTSNVNFRAAKRDDQKEITYSPDIVTEASQPADAVKEVKDAVEEISRRGEASEVTIEKKSE